jgi:hypothetical protein
MVYVGNSVLIVFTLSSRAVDCRRFGETYFLSLEGLKSKTSVPLKTKVAHFLELRGTMALILCVTT